MWIYAIVFHVCLLFSGIYGQFSQGCPDEWEYHNKICYKFETDDPLIFEEADAACWTMGATLLNVDNYQEHKFVADWLVKHDGVMNQAWFTGGEYKDGILTFPIGNSLGSQGYWNSGHRPSWNNRHTHIAYMFSTHSMVAGYGWTTVSPSKPSPYICEIPRKEAMHLRVEQRDFRYGKGRYIQKDDVKTGPVFIVQPTSVYLFDNAPSVFLECAAVGNPHPKYTWQRENGEPITYKESTRYTISGGRFSIQNPVQKADQGSYQCIAENEFGRIVSNPASIKFGYLDHISPVKPEGAEARLSTGTLIKCVGPKANPATAYAWFQYSSEEFIFEDNENIFVSQSGSLYFSSVQQTDGREYFCTITASVPSHFIIGRSQPPSRTSLAFKLDVKGIETGNIQPTIYTHTFPSPALRGGEIRMECVAYGTLPLRYQWRRADGRKFQKGTVFSSYSRVLTIKNAELEAEGTYICTVRGRAGTTSQNITLTIEARPYFKFGIGNKLVDPDKMVRWRCKAIGRAKPIYRWYKDGKLLLPVAGQIDVRENTLTILKATEDHEGMYQCGASNIHGTSYSSGQLKILLIKPNFDRNPFPSMTKIPQGGNYTLPCRVEGAPAPIVVWKKDNTDISVSPSGETSGRIYMAMNYDLTITDIKYSDGGTYRCEASNIEGDAKNETLVQVISGITLSKAPEFTPVRVNRTAFMYCQASWDSLRYDLVYQWQFNGHIINMRNSIHFVQSKKANQDGLYIRQAQFKNDGMYTCVARTTLHSTSRSARLMVQGPPAAPAGVYVRTNMVTSKSVQLVWTVTEFMGHGSDITSYDIEAELGFYPNRWQIAARDVQDYKAKTEAQNMLLRTEQRTANVTGLLPNVHYRFRVRGINTFGRGIEASRPSVSVKTPASKPVKPPNRIRGIDDGKVGTLTIVWDPLDISERGGDGVGYNVYFKKKDDPKEWFKANVTGAESSRYTHLVGVDNFYLEYAVMVSAYNELGGGPNSTVKMIMSAEGMPIATVLMGDCDNYNGSAFSMSWTSVDDTREIIRGRLKGYRLRYWHKEHPDFITYRDLYGQHDSAIIIGLEDNTNYWASVQVMNFAGVGPIGEIRLAETFHLPPQLFPRHVRVYSHTKHSVRVTWQGISTAFDEETLGGYILRVWKIQEDIRTATDTVVDKVNEAILGNLQLHTVYVLRVLGHSIGGEGALSPHVYFTVEGGNIPFDPTTTRYCYDRHLSRRLCDSATTNFISLFLLVGSCIVSILF